MGPGLSSHVWCRLDFSVLLFTWLFWEVIDFSVISNVQKIFNSKTQSTHICPFIQNTPVCFTSNKDTLQGTQHISPKWASCDDYSNPTTGPLQLSPAAPTLLNSILFSFGFSFLSFLFFFPGTMIETYPQFKSLLDLKHQMSMWPGQPFLVASFTEDVVSCHCLSMLQHVSVLHSFNCD